MSAISSNINNNVNGNGGSIESAIDRITSDALAASSASQKDFILSSTWQGSKSGYYFGTTTQEGTGYYIDIYSKQQLSPSASHSNRKRPRDDTRVNGNGDAEANDRKRKVRFGQDQIKFISPKPFKPNSAHLLQHAKQLLKQAEEKQESLNIKTLDLSRGPASLKAFIKNLTKSIAKNELLRVEHPEDPSVFMESEVALYEDISALQDLAANVEYFHEFVKFGAVDQLLALLGHGNNDVALAVIKLFVELLDPGLFTGGDVKSKEGMAALMAAFVGSGSSGGAGLVIEVLARLKDGEEEEMKGIDAIFTLVENLMDLDQLGTLRLAISFENDKDDGAVANSYISVASVVCQSTSFVAYLVEKIGEGGAHVWSIAAKLHASELLATILQHEDSQTCLANLSLLKPMSAHAESNDDRVPAKKQIEQLPIDGIECLLQCVAAFRKRDPSSEEECEYLENIFDALTASLLNEKNVEEFLARQGIELMLRCINERLHSGFGAMKVLFYAVSGPVARKSIFYKKAAESFVDAGGFRSLFPICMGKRSAIPKPSINCDAGNISLLRKYADLNKQNDDEKKKKMSKKMKQVVGGSRDWYHTIEMNAIQILYSLTRHLDENSPNDAKARLLAKFIENDCEKCDRMIELCLKYDKKMRQAEYLYFKSDEAEDAEANGIVDLAALNAKLEGGGELFYRVCAVIAFAAAGSKRCHHYLMEQLRTQSSGIGLIKAGCEEFISVLDDGDHRNQLITYLKNI